MKYSIHRMNSFIQIFLLVVAAAIAGVLLLPFSLFDWRKPVFLHQTITVAEEKLLGFLLRRTIRKMGTVDLSEVVMQLWTRNQVESINTKKIIEMEERIGSIEQTVRENTLAVQNFGSFIQILLERADGILIKREKPN